MISVRGNGPSRVASPLNILGPLLFADYWAADRDNPAAVNPRITIETGASDWPEEGVRNAALLQATGSKQPVLSATSFGGRPGMTFDRAASQSMLATFNPTIAANARIYHWLVFNFTSTTTGDWANASEIMTVGGNSLGIESGPEAGNLCGAWQGVLSDGTDDLRQAAALTTARSVWETGLRSVTTAKFVINGVAYNGTKTGTLTQAIDRFVLGANASDGDHAPVCIHRAIISNGEPSAAQLAAMETLLTGYL